MRSFAAKTNPNMNLATDEALLDVVAALATTALNDGRKTVATPGTPETLVASTTASKRVTVQAMPTNTGMVAVGGTSSVRATGTIRGIILAPFATATINIDDLVKIYVDAEVASDGVTFIYEA